MSQRPPVARGACGEGGPRLSLGADRCGPTQGASHGTSSRGRGLRVSITPYNDVTVLDGFQCMKPEFHMQESFAHFSKYLILQSTLTVFKQL